MSKHTPGPWGLEKAEPERPGNYYVLAPDMNLAIARVYGNSGEANARLIAAAPELLEALVIISGLYSCDASTSDLASRMYDASCIAKTAISKITGEKQC